MCFQEYAPAFASVAPSLVKMLRNLLSVGYAPEHDVAGVSDPFLQVRRVLSSRVLSRCVSSHRVLSYSTASLFLPRPPVLMRNGCQLGAVDTRGAAMVLDGWIDGCALV